MRRAVFLAVLWTAVAGDGLLHAQNWSVGISLGTASFSGASRQADGAEERLSFAPYRPTLWGLAFSYGGDRLRVGLAVRYGEPGIRIRGVPSPLPDEEGTPIVIVVENAYHLSTYTGSITSRLFRLARGPAVRGSLGVALERWAAPGAPVRTIAGGQLGVAAEVALSRAFVAALEGELGWTQASPFRREELPDGFQPRSTWRRSLAGALYWRF